LKVIKYGKNKFINLKNILIMDDKINFPDEQVSDYQYFQRLLSLNQLEDKDNTSGFETIFLN